MTITDLLNGSAGLEIQEGKSYVIFFDPRALDPKSFQDAEAPFEVNIVLVPTVPEPGMTVAESVAAQEAQRIRGGRVQ